MAFTNEETLNILKLILSNEKNYISVVDTEGKYLFTNPALTKIIGKNNDLNTSLINSVHQQDKDTVTDFLKEVLQKGKSESGEYRLIDNNGETHIIKSIGEVIKSNNGHSGKILVISFDLTKEIKIEEDLEKLKIVAEQSTDQVVVTTKEGIVEYVNPAFEKTTGYSKEESIGKTIRKLISGKNDQKFYDDVWGKICNGQSFHGEVINKAKNGEYFSVDKKITPIQNKNGEITHFISTSKIIELQI